MIERKNESLPFALALEKRNEEMSFLTPFSNRRAVLVVDLPSDLEANGHFVAPVSIENGVARYVLRVGRYLFFEFCSSSGRARGPVEARFYFFNLLPRELEDSMPRFYEIARFRRDDYTHFRHDVLLRAFRSLIYDDLKRVIDFQVHVDWVPGLKEFIDFLLKL